MRLHRNCLGVPVSLVYPVLWKVYFYQASYNPLLSPIPFFFVELKELKEEGTTKGNRRDFLNSLKRHLSKEAGRLRHVLYFFARDGKIISSSSVIIPGLAANGVFTG